LSAGRLCEPELRRRDITTIVRSNSLSRRPCGWLPCIPVTARKPRAHALLPMPRPPACHLDCRGLLIVQAAFALQIVLLAIEFLMQRLAQWSPWAHLAPTFGRAMIAALALAGAVQVLRHATLPDGAKRAARILTWALAALTLWHMIVIGLWIIRALGFPVISNPFVRDWLSLLPGALWFIVLVCAIPVAAALRRRADGRRLPEFSVFLLLATSVLFWLMLRLYEYFRSDLGAQPAGLAVWRLVLFMHGLWALTMLIWTGLIRRTRPPRQCRACGYDLTGNESGVCPECGIPATRNEATR